MALAFTQTGSRGATASIVALHGAGMSKEAWAPVGAHLGDTHVVAIDLPGHGGSTDTHASSAEEMLSHVVALLDSISVERALWAGHSMGGLVSQAAAAAHPARVRGLVLVATTARFKVPGGFTEAVAADFEGTVAGMMTASFGPGVPAATVEDYARVMRLAGIRGVEDAFRVCATFDGRAALARIDVPTAVLSAEHDVLAPVVVGERLAGGIRGATFELLMGAGHMLLAERPADVARAILDVQRRIG